MTVRFGPAGNSDSFYNSGHKSSLETFPWLREKGLDVPTDAYTVEQAVAILKAQKEGKAC